MYRTRSASNFAIWVVTLIIIAMIAVPGSLILVGGQTGVGNCCW